MLGKLKNKTFYIIAFLFVLALITPEPKDQQNQPPEITNPEATINTKPEPTSQEALVIGGASTSNNSIETQNNLSDTSGTGGKVLYVVDGDTVKVDLNGKIETIRVIGINTPETVHPEKTVECFGREASAEAKRLLSDQKVIITYDDSQGTYDKYGRTLAYISLPDSSDFGETMIRSGFAYEYTYNLPYDRQAKYKAAETYAKENKVGLWADGACDNFEASPTSINTLDTNQNTNTSEVVTTNTSNCLIKGNISKSGEKIYHVPGQQYYTKTIISEDKGEQWFCTEKEAVEAGWRRALR
ncbi:MAG: thermonuclease family protein [Candidatus Nomurabacteria bacterium]|nr:thermonuclease family protein [Candidatus Nomurabacteria bacterium]USN87468.1 MAG: thermonuclease family protein [Candidatus Nomurabacteria bacterium]